MDYHDQPLGLQPPKLWFIPARPLVCLLATLGMISRVFLLIGAENWEIRVPHIIYLFLNALLLFGAAKNNEPALKWSQRVVFVCVILAIITFLIWPVAFASYTASGLADNKTIEASVEKYTGDLFKKETAKERMFMRGLITGYAFEIGAGLVIAMEILKYVLVNRLWVYAKATEHIEINHYISP